jgi:hypothetical protein
MQFLKHDFGLFARTVFCLFVIFKNIQEVLQTMPNTEVKVQRTMPTPEVRECLSHGNRWNSSDNTKELSHHHPGQKKEVAA